MLYVLVAIFRCCWLTIAVYSFVGGNVQFEDFSLSLGGPTS
jgi:hypothetical protein